MFVNQLSELISISFVCGLIQSIMSWIHKLAIKENEIFSQYRIRSGMVQNKIQKSDDKINLGIHNNYSN